MLYGEFQEVTREDSLNISTTSKTVANVTIGNPRKTILIRNTSEDTTSVISISFGQKQAENGKGIILKQNESFSDSTSEGYTAYQGQINAICSDANGKIAVFER